MSLQNNTIKTIAKGGVFSFFAQILGTLLGLITTIMLTRYMGAYVFGIYALGLTLFRLSTKVSMLGMNNGILRYFQIFRDKPKELKGLLISAFSIVTIISIVFMVLSLLLAKEITIVFFDEKALETTVRLFSLALPFIVCNNIIASTYQSEKNVFKYFVIRDLYQKVIYILLLSILAFWSINLQSAVVTFIISSISVFVIAIISFIKDIFPLIKDNASSTIYHLKDLIQFSAPSFLIGFSYILLTQIDRIMIGVFLDSSSVGIYFVAAKIAVFMNIILASFNTIFVPHISKLFFNDKKDELESLYKVVTKWVWILSIPLFVFFFFLANPILSIFGEDFSSGWLAFIVLSFFFLLNSACGSNGFIIQMIGRPILELFNCVCVLIINIGLNIIFIKKFGIEGAALATGISLLLINIIRLFEIFFIIKMHPFTRSYVFIGIGFILSGFFAMSIRNHLNIGFGNHIIPFLAFSILYFGFVYLFCLNQDDELILYGIKDKFGSFC